MLIKLDKIKIYTPKYYILNIHTNKYWFIIYLLNILKDYKIIFIEIIILNIKFNNDINIRIKTN